MDDEPALSRSEEARGTPEKGRGGHAEARPRGARRRLFPAVLLFAGAALAGGIYLLAHRGAQESRAAFGASAPIPVGAAAVAKGDMPITLSGLGTVTPLLTVTVQSQVSGQLMAVGFHQGRMVTKGQFLAQIDPRPFEVALEQAKAQLAKDTAVLANDKVNLARYDKLLAQKSIAAQVRDNAAALVRQDTATAAADKALIDAQKLNLAYAHILAPITGMAGLRLVDPGNYVQANAAGGIVVLTQMDPISVVFSIPEKNLPAVLARLRKGARLKAEAYDQSGTKLIASGRLFALDNQINTTTGTLNLRAIFQNAEERLFPNQFVNVRLLVDTLKGALLVPNAAVQRGSPGTFVYVIEADDKVKVAPVTLGPGTAEEVAVLKGLEEGQKVVVDGADRLSAGAKVQIVGAPSARPP